MTGGCTPTHSAATAALPPESLNYIFTDPPFGENIYYADMNILVESWHRVFTNTEPEAIRWAKDLSYRPLVVRDRSNPDKTAPDKWREV